MAQVTVLDRVALHALLVGMAGRVPDDDLAVMRTCLADAEENEVAFLLAAAVETSALALTEDEVPVIRALFNEFGVDLTLTDHAPRVTSLEPCPFRFSGTPGPYEEVAPSTVGVDGHDTMDTAVIEAAARVGGLTALWRAFRYRGDGAARRVYLGEASAEADVAELVAEVQHALSEAGEDTPRVEVFREGEELTPYHEGALAAAVLIWADTDADVRLARVFDGADPDTGPYFETDHPRLEGADGERVLAYLRGGELVLNTPGALDDVLDEGRTGAVPVGFRSDGRWVWPETVAYYLKRHGLAPEPELVAYALAAPTPGPLNRLARHRAMVALFTPTGVEPVWQAG